MADDPPKMDFKAFQRNVDGVLGYTTYLRGLESYVRQIVSQNLDPEIVPMVALEAMGHHPTVYLAERIVSGIVRRPDLYSVRHANDRIAKETEEWLWPLLPQLCGAAARAFSYGTVPVIFNWGRETLVFRAVGPSGKERRRTEDQHTHYVSAHDIRYSEATIKTQGDELLELTYAGQPYDPDRVHMFVWDREFGQWLGKSARRRAYRDYCAALILDQLEAAYLERSVDSPRVAYAPPGTFQADGETYSTSAYVAQLLNQLKGGGAAVWPNSRDQNGNKLYEIATLDLPDRSNVWSAAIGRREQRILVAYLALVGADLSAGSARTLDGLLKEIVQDLAEWVAQNLTRIVEIVHRANHDPIRVPPPEVVATDVGKTRVQKSLAEVLRMVESGRVSRHVDVAKALDALGIPIVDHPEELEQADAQDQQPGQPGRPREAFGDREERRENAATEEGSEDVGKSEPMGRDPIELAVPTFQAQAKPIEKL